MRRHDLVIREPGLMGQNRGPGSTTQHLGLVHQRRSEPSEARGRLGVLGATCVGKAPGPILVMGQVRAREECL